MLPFWLSIGLLSLTQGVIVALAGTWSFGRWKSLGRLKSRWWGTIPPASVLLFVLVGSFAERGSAKALTYLALGGVPVGAALALGWLARGRRPWLALVAAPLFVLAWVDRAGLGGEAAAVALSGLSCVALGVLLAAVTPARWLALGIVAMAIVDTILVGSDLLQAPNNALNAAHPVAGLPRLQAAVLGSAVMGYGDLFVAGVFGGLLAVTRSRGVQWSSAALVVGLALVFDLLFFVVDELPATVPVALALGALVAWERVPGAGSPFRVARDEADRARAPRLEGRAGAERAGPVPPPAGR